jgi:chemotaxis protein CheY-P-specific phosphatase CheC
MEVDIQSLSTFNRLADEGATRATAMLAQMTGIEADVEVTKITLLDRADLGEELGISQQAVASRLRRGIKTVLGKTLSETSGLD